MYSRDTKLLSKLLQSYGWSNSSAPSGQKAETRRCRNDNGGLELYCYLRNEIADLLSVHYLIIKRLELSWTQLNLIVSTTIIRIQLTREEILSNEVITAAYSAAIIEYNQVFQARETCSSIIACSYYNSCLHVRYYNTKSNDSPILSLELTL